MTLPLSKFLLRFGHIDYIKIDKIQFCTSTSVGLHPLSMAYYPGVAGDFVPGYFPTWTAPINARAVTV